MTLDDEDNVSEASFYTAVGGSDRPLDLRSSSPEDVDPTPRRTARERALAERDVRAGMIRRRAYSVSDDEEYASDGDYRREKSRQRIAPVSTIRGGSEDIIHQSSLMLDFSFALPIAGPSKGFTGGGTSPVVGRGGVSDSEMDGEMESEDGEAFRRSLAAEMEAMGAPYLGLQTFDTTPRPFQTDSLPQLHRQQSSLPVSPNSKSTFTTKVTSKSSCIDHTTPTTSGASEVPMAVASSSRHESTGIYPLAHGSFFLENRIVDGMQHESLSTEHSMANISRVPQTPPCPPPLSEPDIELFDNSAPVDTVEFDPFPKTPPGLPPSSITRSLRRGDLEEHQSEDESMEDVDTPAPDRATLPQTKTKAVEGRGSRNDRHMPDPYLVTTPEGDKPILRRWDPNRDGLDKVYESLANGDPSGAKDAERISRSSITKAQQPGKQASSSRSPPRTAVVLANAAAPTEISRASSSSAKAAARLQAEKSRQLGLPTSASSTAGSVSSNESRPIEPPSLLSRISGVSFDESRSSASSSFSLSHSSTSYTIPTMSPPWRPPTPPPPLSPRRERSPPHLPNQAASSSRPASSVLPGASLSTRTSTEQIQVSNVPSTSSAVVPKPSLTEGQDHPKPSSRVRSALGKALSNAATGPQIMRFLRMETDHIRGTCLKGYELIFDPDNDCPSRSFLESLVINLGGIVTPFDSPRTKEKPSRKDVKRIWVAKDADTSASGEDEKVVIDAERYTSALLLDLITRLREEEVMPIAVPARPAVAQTSTTAASFEAPIHPVTNAKPGRPSTKPKLKPAAGLQGRLGQSAQSVSQQIPPLREASRFEVPMESKDLASRMNRSISSGTSVLPPAAPASERVASDGPALRDRMTSNATPVEPLRTRTLRERMR